MREVVADSPGRKTPRRRSLLAASVLVATSGLIGIDSLAPFSNPAASAQTDDAAAERAAREIQAARDRANAAANAYFQAESDLELLEDDLIRLEDQQVQLQATVDALRQSVERVAVSRFVNSGVTGIPLLTGIQAPQDQVQAEVFVDVLRNTGSDTLDRYDVAQKNLRANERDLEAQRQSIEAQQVVFVQLQRDAEAEVDRLRAIEEERLKDEAVRKALEAQLAEERARLEEEARRQAEAASRAVPDPGAGLPEPTLPPVADDGQAPADGNAADAATDATTESTVPPTTLAPRPAPSTGASGGTSGGRTGTGGTGSNPRPVENGAGYIDAIICPMPGSAYGDTWGAPRSGGRRHEGVDMIAPRGTPIYAVVSGTVTFKSNRLGGNAASLVGDNGTRYYYAHFDSYAGSSRRVNQGEVIGYNGDTGNARGTPHLHFEIHPGGGLAVNPTPSVRAAGC